MKIGFAILLNEESHNFARKVELELCEKFGICWGLKQPPHITVKTPFEVENIEPFIKYVDNLAKEFSPFEIQLDGFNHFESTIFLNVKENLHLKRIHLKIINDLKLYDIEPGVYEGENVKFHSTIAARDVDMSKAKEYLKNHNPKFKFLADTLAIFYYLSDEAGWIIVNKQKLVLVPPNSNK